MEMKYLVANYNPQKPLLNIHFGHLEMVYPLL
jgi:hypothetical protein